MKWLGHHHQVERTIQKSMKRNRVYDFCCIATPLYWPGELTRRQWMREATGAVLKVQVRNKTFYKRQMQTR